MLSRQASCKERMLPVLIVVFALWANVAIAGVNENLLEAAKRGDLDEVTSLVDKGADVNAKDNRGATALMFASDNGHRRHRGGAARQGGRCQCQG